MSDQDDYLVELYKALDYSQTEFDKSLTYISSGILAISYAFIDKVVNLKEAEFKALLIQGWIIISISIAISLLAHGASTVFLALSITHHGDEIKSRQIRNGSNIVVWMLNIVTITLLVIGSINIFNFIRVNL